jgi:hypothetical protein
MRPAVLLLACLLAACAAADRPGSGEGEPTPQGQRELGMLAAFLPGTWDALPQPGQSATRLRMVEFWKKDKGERWIYAEYVNPAEDARPVRQRIYRFTERGRKIYGDVFKVPARFAGEWRKPDPFDGVGPGDLERFEKCRLVFVRQHEALFAGGTEGRECRGDRPGVAYERSEFHLSSATLRHLDQGFDAAGRVVAGEARPWELRKTSRVPR